MDKNKKLDAQRSRRAFRVRKKVRGSPERPRISVTRSLAHFGCQVIDDTTGRTIVAAHTADKSLRGQNKSGGNCASAAAVGKRIAELALQAGIKQVCLDRGHYRFHGRVKAFADAAREAGLEF